MSHPTRLVTACTAVATLLVVLLAACGRTVAPADAAGGSATDTDNGAPTAAVATVDAIEVVLLKTPTCGCCGEHEAYLRDAWMDVQVTSRTT